MIIAVAKSSYYLKSKHRRTVLFVQGSSYSGFIVVLVVVGFVCFFVLWAYLRNSIVEPRIACFYVAEL